ncbi:peptidoglycan DD-metalloendopeptidase family protein, partial [Eubacterium aggregans]|uniref:peptidoglycan DD-metalloendopeptidase family protein n=1 Tax=Eubacterium aggregans TaxID=81409 RepID=UPI003F3E7CBC
MADFTLSSKITGDAAGYEKAVAQVQKATDKLKQSTGKSLKDIAGESGKTVNEIKADVMKAANAYARSGMTMSEAMKKAYADIGYSASTAEGVVSQSIERIQSKLSSIGSRFQGMGKSISSVGKTLTDKSTKPALIATSALAGLTMVKGFNRLVGIDEAQAKLKALGHDAENVTAIMDSALTSVKGIAFGLDEVATTAASAVAAGIKPGQELTRYLSLTGDAAAIAGASMSDMGSIFNKVQTAQRAYTEDLNQLADRGIPIYQWLADECGVTADEIRDMATDGQISSEMFLNAIDKNIGGAAKIMGETSFKAAMANIGASLSKIGANFLDAGGKGGGFFSTLKPLLSEFNEWLGTVEDKVADLGVKFGEAFSRSINKVKEVKEKFETLPKPLQDTILKAVGFGAAFAVAIGPVMKILGPLIGGVGTLASGFGKLLGPASELGNAMFPQLAASAAEAGGGFGGLMSALGLGIGPLVAIVGAVAGFAAVLVGAWQHSEKFRDAVGEAFTAIKGSIEDAMAKIASAMEPVKSAFAEAWETMGPVLQQIGDFLGTKIVPALEWFATTAIWAIGEAISALSPLFSAIGNVMSCIGNFVGFVFALFNGDWAEAWNFAKGMVKNVCDFIMNIGQTVANVLGIGVKAIANTMASTWTWIYNTVSRIASGILNDISTTWNNVITATKTILGNLLGTVTRGFQGAIDFVSGLPERFSEYGKGMIQSLIDGVNNMITGAKDAIVGIANGIKDAFCEALGINSPSTWFSAKAGDMVQGLVNDWKNSHFAQWVNGTIEWMKEKFKNSTEAVMAFFKKMGTGALGFLKDTLGIDLSGIFGAGGGITGGRMVLPVNGTVTDEFGERESPGAGASTYHEGMDFGAAEGTPIAAAASGTVSLAGWNGGYGNCVIIDHGGGLQTLYGHQSAVAVSKGQQVTAGQTIGHVGNTGTSFGAHLHFSVMQDGNMIDPRLFLGSFETGLARVPRDGFAFIHRNEGIVTANQNKALNSGRPLGLMNWAGNSMQRVAQDFSMTGTDAKISGDIYQDIT